MSVDEETLQVATGALVLEVDMLRKDGVEIELIEALWTELAAVYRKWEMRELPSPAYAAYHYVHHWLVNGSDVGPASLGRGRFFTDDVALAQRFDTLEEIDVWIRERGLMHPDYPINHERAGFTILRVK